MLSRSQICEPKGSSRSHIHRCCACILESSSALLQALKCEDSHRSTNNFQLFSTLNRKTITKGGRDRCPFGSHCHVPISGSKGCSPLPPLPDLSVGLQQPAAGAQGPVPRDSPAPPQKKGPLSREPCREVSSQGSGRSSVGNIMRPPSQTKQVRFSLRL